MNAQFLKGVFLPLIFLLTVSCQPGSGGGIKFEISIDPSLHTDDFDGRLMLFISDNDRSEPKSQVSDSPSTQMLFGQNAEGWSAGTNQVMDQRAFGYPLESFTKIPAGEYFVQVLLHKYETFNRADGHTVKLPMNRGAGQNWRRAPGNIYSKPIKVTIDPAKSQTINLDITEINPPMEEPEDTKYIKHIKMKSEMLSEFWGRDIYLGAHILLPEGFDEHPEAKYPLMVFHGHFPNDFGGFRTTPPDPDMKPVYSSRFDLEGYNIIQEQEAYDFYRQWISDDFPRMLIIEIQHANPFYDDSYAVNSANIGPYGDAITYELIPYIEEQFRGIGEGWARFLYGGSTGGWEALAAQVFYPDEYNGCFAACPDPIDFRAYSLVNLYQDENAYYLDGKYRKSLRAAKRDYLGNVTASLRDMNMRELALGDKGRSGDQWDVWQAVYAPVGNDGYPKPVWDKYSGEIDQSVATHFKENYDLRYIMERDWAELGPRLRGKLNIYCGDMDNYYLNNAVYLAEDFLENTKNPYYAGDVAYGDRAEHCWNGDPDLPNAISRLRYNSMYVPKIMKRIKESAPKGADLTSWRY